MKRMDLLQFIGRLKGMEPRAFFLFLAGALVICLVLDVFLILGPQIGLIRHLTRNTAQLRTDMDTFLVNKQRMAQFRAGLDQARGRMHSFRAMVHRPDSMPAVLKAVSTVANQCGVKVDQLVPQKSDGVVLVKNEDGQYTSFSFLIQARAGYHELGRFLHELEAQGVSWQLSSFEMAADTVDPARHVVKIEMKVLVLEE